MAKIELLNRAQQAEFLNERGYPITKGTLAKLASTGGGPSYRIFGNKALATPEDLLEWAESRLSAPQVSTSE